MALRHVDVVLLFEVYLGVANTTLSQNILLFGNRSLKSVCMAANMSGGLRININILLATHGPCGFGLIS